MIIKCPNCTDGYVMGFGCLICGGAGKLAWSGPGELPADVTYDPERGARLKQERREKGESLREYSKRTGESAIERSRQERGYFQN